MRKLLILLLLPISALGADATASWTHPTQYEDGTPLPLTGIRETRVQYGSCTTATPPAFDVAAGTVVSPAPNTSIVITGLAAGTYCFRALTVDTAGQMSVWSNVATKTIAPPKPKPPVMGVVR